MYAFKLVFIKHNSEGSFEVADPFQQVENIQLFKQFLTAAFVPLRPLEAPTAPKIIQDIVDALCQEVEEIVLVIALFFLVVLV